MKFKLLFILSILLFLVEGTTVYALNDFSIEETQTYLCTSCLDEAIQEIESNVVYTCSKCDSEFIRISKQQIVTNQGGVDAASGTLNTTFTNNWYSNISIPVGATKVNFQVFKTGGNWGSAFFGDNGYLSGYANKKEGGIRVELDIPADATIFRYGYLYDQIAINNNFPIFDYVEFVGTDITLKEDEGFMERPANGTHSFSVKVNIKDAVDPSKDYVEGTDYGYIVFPKNYTKDGEGTRLVITCHGAGATLPTYQSQNAITTNYTFFTDLGYAVMDMYACPTEISGSDTCLHYGHPAVVECYKAGYEYVLKNFNIKQDGIYVVGSSMGGLSSFQIVQSGEFPVLGLIGYCPAIDLFKQAYMNPWSSGSYQRSRIAQYFLFEGVKPTFTNTKYASDEEIEYYINNKEKINMYSPLTNSIISGDIDKTFTYTPKSATTVVDEKEAALYEDLVASFPCPVLIFHNLDDPTVPYRYSKYFTEMIQRSGQTAILHTFESGGHNAWNNGPTSTIPTLVGNRTWKESRTVACKFIENIEKHETHYEWVIPGVDATCTSDGLISGVKCAKCQEILVEQTVIPALGHDYKDVVTNPTCTEKGFTTHTCDRCSDSYVDSYIDALGHNLVIDEAVEPTCTNTGLTKGSHCSRCDYKEEQEIIPVLGHDYESIVTNPTCTEQGFTTHTCSRCSDIYVDSYVDPLAHSYSEWEIILDATEEQTGLKRKICKACGDVIEEVIPMLEHTHKYESTEVLPTCTEVGYTVHSCKCGESYKDSYVDALGHDLIIDEAVDATCTTTGLTKGVHCSRCEYLEEQEEIRPLGHSYSEWEVITDATCSETGLKQRICKTCNNVEESVIQKEKHIESVWIIDVPSTDIATGKKHTECVNCGIIIKEQIIPTSTPEVINCASISSLLTIQLVSVYSLLVLVLRKKNV